MLLIDWLWYERYQEPCHFLPLNVGEFYHSALVKAKHVTCSRYYFCIYRDCLSHHYVEVRVHENHTVPCIMSLTAHAPCITSISFVCDFLINQYPIQIFIKEKDENGIGKVCVCGVGGGCLSRRSDTKLRTNQHLREIRIQRSFFPISVNKVSPDPNLSRFSDLQV